MRPHARLSDKIDHVRMPLVGFSVAVQVCMSWLSEKWCVYKETQGSYLQDWFTC